MNEPPPSFLNRFLASASDDLDVSRRQFVLSSVVLALILVGGLWIVVDLLTRLLAGTLAATWPSRLHTYLCLGAGLAVDVGAYLLSRRGRIEMAGYLLIATVLGFTACLTWYGGIEIGYVVLYFLGIALAGMLLGGKASLIVATVAFLLYSGMGVLQHLGIQPTPLISPLLANVVGFGLVLYLVAALNWLATWHLSFALQSAQQQAVELQAAREEQALLLTDLRAQAEEQSHLAHMVEDLAAPVIVIHDRMIALPLVGYVDNHRAELIRHALLQGITRHRAVIALLDLTGLSKISPETGRHLEAMSRAGRLLGAKVVLVGIHAEAAAEMIKAGTDLCSLEVRRDLQSGIEWALSSMGKRIVIDD
jgi:anti-anti-sigma regulatory factor